MPLIPSKLHGVADYATAAALISAPTALRMRHSGGAAVLRCAGAGVLAASLVTDYEVGAWRRLPLPAHLALDAAGGALLAASPWLLGHARRSPREWVPHVVFGVAEIGAAALSRRRPDNRQAEGAGRDAPGAAAETGPGGEVQHGLAPVHAAPPPETPGPSVTAPARPESETERAERTDATKPDPELLAETARDPLDALVREEESAAAAEAAAIGGPAPGDAPGDPALEAVHQAGGGEAEGFEAAEADLIENATHGDGHGDPARDAFPPEAEAGAAETAYGEPDRVAPTEAVDDPDTPRP